MSKLSVTVIDSFSEFCLSGRATAFKVLDAEEALTMAREATEDGLIAVLAGWNESFVPKQWDDRAFDYRV